jgi:hypothetical protein
MPIVSNATLTLTTVNNDTTISVSFDTIFSPFERELAGLGLGFHPHIDVIGVDPAGSTTGTVLSLPTTFPQTSFPVTPGGAVSQTIPRTLAITVPRSSLQEDPAAGDADEIRCRIRIHALGMPPEFTPDLFTPQQVLVG